VGRVKARVVPLLLFSLAVSLALVDVAYASPGPWVAGCRATLVLNAWTIIANIFWQDAGISLPILIDLYKAIGGARVGRQQDSVSGTGSKDYSFTNIPGGPDDRFIIDVQYYDQMKQDWVHTPGKQGIMECPRPGAQYVTETTTLTNVAIETVIQEKTFTAEVQRALSLGEAYWSYLALLGLLVGLTLGYGLNFMSRYLPAIWGGKPPTPCGTSCTCGGKGCNLSGTHCRTCSNDCSGTCTVLNLPDGSRHEGPHVCSHGHTFHQR